MFTDFDKFRPEYTTGNSRPNHAGSNHHFTLKNTKLLVRFPPIWKCYTVYFDDKCCWWTISVTYVSYCLVRIFGYLTLTYGTGFLYASTVSLVGAVMQESNSDADNPGSVLLHDDACIIALKLWNSRNISLTVKRKFRIDFVTTHPKHPKYFNKLQGEVPLHYTGKYGSCIYAFVASVVLNCRAEGYWHWLTFVVFIAKINRVNFFWDKV